MTVYYLAARSLPDYSNTVQVTGLTAPVEIVRDNANVPHIFGASDPDVFYGLGYAHAQDRLWQMMMMRRTAQGRLSEAFGPRTLRIDTLLRRLDFYGLAVQSFAAQDPYTQAALQAYAGGVNARIDEINRDALGRGAPEFFLFGQPLAPWKPADSLVITRLMALQLSGHLEEEVLRARASLMLDNPDRLADLMPDTPGQGIAALPAYAQLFEGLSKFAASTPLPDHPLYPIKHRAFAGASNGWAASAARSASGGALLANDPHLGFSAPSIWYLARIELASGGVIGGTIPGLPVVLAGRNQTLGWGITSSYLDDQDIFIEQLNPDNSDEYLGPDGYERFQSRPSIIKIKDEAPVTLTLRWTANGPVLDRNLYSLDTVTPDGHVAALSWTALSPGDTSVSAGMALMRAGNVDAGIEAGAGFIAPSQNLTLADTNGRVAMKTIGAMPRRDRQHQSQGRIPSPGWIAQNRWQGRFPYSSNPGFVDPLGGIVGNTNNKTVERPFPLHVSYSWGDTQRIHRWERLMQLREVHTRESFIEAQQDTVSFTARSLLPLVGADLWFTGQSAAEGTPDRLRQDALKLLADWIGEMNEHMPEPLLYSAWMRALQDRLIRDELGPLADEFTHPEPVLIERIFKNIDGAGIWCDIVQSAITETCTDIAKLALDDALVWISDTYGTALESLRWGDAHQATHDHQVLGDVPVLRYFMNIRQSTSGGDNTLLRGRTKGSGANPFLNVHGAAFRGVYDFMDPDSSVFIISTGQSGHFLSRHYDDMGVLWRRGEYVPMSLDADLARAGAVGVTQLVPVP